MRVRADAHGQVGTVSPPVGRRSGLPVFRPLLFWWPDSQESLKRLLGRKSRAGLGSGWPEGVRKLALHSLLLSSLQASM